MSNQDSSLNAVQQQLLKAFKQQISKAETQAPVATAPQEAAEPDLVDDSALFNQALQGVTALKQHNQAAIAPIKKPVVDAKTLAKRANAEGQLEIDDTELSDTHAMLNPVGSQAMLSYRIGTLQHKVFEDLKAGNLRWYEAVDLHGCTIEEARSAVLQVIQMAQAENQNVVKIVHGKGPQAILKSYVNSWLRQHRDVLAFVSAPEKQGGTGAVLVLLKRAEKNPKYLPNNGR